MPQGTIGSFCLAGTMVFGLTPSYFRSGCRISNVAIAERSCEITFKKRKRSLKGREANEVFATLASAGVAAEGAAGSMIESVTKLSCTLDPAEIRDNSGGGADCSFATDQ